MYIQVYEVYTIIYLYIHVYTKKTILIQGAGIPDAAARRAAARYAFRVWIGEF